MAISHNKDKNRKIISYRAVFYDGKKKISQKNFRRHFDATKWLAEQKRKLDLGYELKLSFRKACKEWLEFHSKPKHSPATSEEATRMVEKIFLPFFGDKELDQLSTRDVEGLIAYLKKQGIKNATVNRYLQALKCIINYFRKKEYIQKNVVSIVGILPEEPTEANYLSLEQAKFFLNHVNAKYQRDKRWVYAFYLLALNTGMRIGEILALKWDCVDLLGKRLIVRRSYCHQTQQIRETTKGRKIRHLGINSSLLPELQELWKKRNTDDSLVFCNTRNKILNMANFKRDFYQKDLREAGLPWIKIHELRHTFASHFVMNNGNLYDLQKLLGHTHVRTTERYAHLAPDHLIHQTERVAIDGKNNVIDISKRFQNRKLGRNTI